MFELRHGSRRGRGVGAATSTYGVWSRLLARASHGPETDVLPFPIGLTSSCVIRPARSRRSAMAPYRTAYETACRSVSGSAIWWSRGRLPGRATTASCSGRMQMGRCRYAVSPTAVSGDAVSIKGPSCVLVRGQVNRRRRGGRLRRVSRAVVSICLSSPVSRRLPPIRGRDVLVLKQEMAPYATFSRPSTCPSSTCAVGLGGGSLTILASGSAVGPRVGMTSSGVTGRRRGCRGAGGGPSSVCGHLT